MMGNFEKRGISWCWIAVGAGLLTVLVGAYLLIHWLFTPAGLLALLAAVTATSGIAIKKKNGQAFVALIIMFGIAFVPGFYTTYQKQKTDEIMKQVMPAIEQMNRTNQNLIHSVNSPVTMPTSARPMYLPSPTALKEGWKPPV